MEPIEVESRRWLDAVERETGPLALFDAHTHFGRNDPDGYRQEPAQLLAALELAGARAVTFPMHEPNGYPAANDEALAAAADSDGRLVAFCRVNPHDGALAEARRCLDAGARGIKLHPRAERFALHEGEVEALVALADERRVPVLIHAGRGIPALGADTLELAERHPGAHLILAHGAVSDLAWLWRQLPRAPERPDRHLVVEPGRPDRPLLPGAAGPDPLGQRLALRDAGQLRCLPAALRARRRARPGGDRLGRRRSDRARPRRRGPRRRRPRAGTDRPARPRHGAGLLPPPRPPPAAPSARPTSAESLALARLACDLEGEHAAACGEVIHLLELAERHDVPPPPGRRFPRSLQFLILALTVARTPDVALPGPPAA